MSPTKITSLTAEQEVELSQAYSQWLAVGRSCEPLDRPEATKVLGEFYAAIGKPAPVALFFSSPAMCILAWGALSQLDSQLRWQLRSQLRSQLRWQLDSQLDSQLGSQLDSQLRSQLGSQLESQLESQLDSQLRSQLRWQLESQLRSQLDSQLRSQLESQLGSQLESQLRWQLESQLRWQLDSQLDSQLGSQLWSQLESQLGSQLDSQLRSQLDSQLDSQLRSQLDSQLDSQLGSQLWSQLESQLGSQLDSQLRSQLESQLGSQLESQLRWQLRWQLDSQLDSQLESQLWSQLRLQLESQLWSQLGSQLESQLDSQLRLQLGNCFAGQHWCAGEVFYAFCAQIGVKYTAEQSAGLDLWLRQSRALHWWFPYDGLVIASERHTELHVDDRGRLHHADRMACGYSDGWGVYSWHGIQIPERYYLEPVTAKAILQERNAEVRRALIERHGQDRFILDAGAKVVDVDLNHGAELLAIDLPEDPDERMVCLKLRCPSTNAVYIVRVPPDQRKAREALAWSHGMAEADYQLVQET